MYKNNAVSTLIHPDGYLRHNQWGLEFNAIQLAS